MHLGMRLALCIEEECWLVPCGVSGWSFSVDWEVWLRAISLSCCHILRIPSTRCCLMLAPTWPRFSYSSGSGRGEKRREGRERKGKEGREGEGEEGEEGEEGGGKGREGEGRGGKGREGEGRGGKGREGEGRGGGGRGERNVIGGLCNTNIQHES